MPTEPIAVIWDVDGTLVDTAELHFAAWVRLAGEMGRPFSRDDFSATFGRRNPEIIRFLFRQEFTDAEVLDIGERKETYYRSAAEAGVQLLPGVRELLDGLRLAQGAPGGRFQRPARQSRPHPENYEQPPLLRRDRRHGRHARGKPDPQVFLVAAEKLGVPPNRCVVLEDAVAGVEAAKAGGMKCVAVTFVGHHSADKLKAAGADRVVKSFTEITADDVIGLFAEPSKRSAPHPETSRRALRGNTPQPPDESARDVRTALYESRPQVGIETEHIVHDQYLPVAMRTGADADRWDLKATQSSSRRVRRDAFHTMANGPPLTAFASA